MTATTSPSVAAEPRSSGFGAFLAQMLSDRERYFTEVVAGEGLATKLWYSTWTLISLCALYGAAAGAYASAAQALASAIKLPLLFLGTVGIGFPGFFIVQVLLGSRLRFPQVLALVLGSLALSAVLLAAVIPVTVFFLFTGANYYFLTLLHVVIVLAAGLVGMAALHEGLAFACEQRGVYPKKAMAIMKVWAVLFAFVGIQMAWNLQPFVGDRGEPFRLFRHNEGNFYTALVYSLQQLARGEDKRSSVGARPDPSVASTLLESAGLRAPDSLYTTRP